MGDPDGVPVELEVSGRIVRLSSPDKLMFPKVGVTKHDLAKYYLSVEGPLLAAMGNRPVLLQGFPKGVSGPSFFQKRVPKGAPEWLQTTTVETPNGTASNALVVADLAHVIWAVGQGCLALHVWPYKYDRPEFCDELRVDLDPSPGVSFDRIRSAALVVKETLEELGMTSFVKTSGSKGLHVYVSLSQRWDAYQVRSAAVAFARELERRYPDEITAQWWKEDRGERVFVDFNQNAPHKTVFGAWSVRPRVGAQVSTPLGWFEVSDVEPDSLTVKTVPARVKSNGDPWGERVDRPQDLTRLLAWHERDMADGLMDAPWPPQYPKQPNEAPRVAPSRAKKSDDTG